MVSLVVPLLPHVCELSTLDTWITNANDVSFDVFEYFVMCEKILFILVRKFAIY